MTQTDRYDLAFVTVDGTDAQNFLNGQFTNNVLDMREGDTCLGAFCTPKGRVIALAEITCQGDVLSMAVESALVAKLLNTLRRYVMRANVQFDVDTQPELAGADTELRAQRIKRGLPRVTPATSEQFIPQMLNLDLLRGIDFTKGCYTGQEIVARTHNLGTIKRRMLGYRYSGGDVTPGMAVVTQTGEKVGQIVDAIDDRLLAVMRLARIDDALQVENSAARLSGRWSLPYAIPELDD